jgi:hypothetical protein
MRIRLSVYFLVLCFYAFSGVTGTQLVPALEPLFRLVNVGADALMILLAFTVFLRNKDFYGVRLMVLFLVASAFTLAYNLDRLGPLDHFNGIRQPVVFLAALVVTYDFFRSDYAEAFVRWFTRFLVVFVILQTPLSAWQFSLYGAGDWVGGTYGKAGGSGFITQLVFLIAFYFIVRYGSNEEGTNFRLSRILLFSLVLAPIAFNETKIAFVFLAVYLVMLVVSRQNVFRMSVGLVLGAGLLFLLNWLYSENVGSTGEIFTTKFIERYLVYDSRQGVDIPRFQKILLMFGVLAKDLFSIVVGLGYGLFSGLNILGSSRFARTLWYFNGTRPLLNTVWIQGGLLATAIFATASFGFLRENVIYRSNMRRFKWFLAAIVGTIWFYNDALLDRTFAMIIGFLMMWIYFGGIDTGIGEGARASGETAASTAEGEQSS